MISIIFGALLYSLLFFSCPRKLVAEITEDLASKEPDYVAKCPGVVKVPPLKQLTVSLLVDKKLRGLWKKSGDN